MLIDDLVQARKAKKITQAELAEASGMTQSVIARIESKKTDPRLSTIEKLTAALKTEIHLSSPNDKQ